MVGWHYWLHEHEFGQTLGDGEGQGSLGGCSPWGLKDSDTTWPLNNKARVQFRGRWWGEGKQFSVGYLLSCTDICYLFSSPQLFSEQGIFLFLCSWGSYSLGWKTYSPKMPWLVEWLRLAQIFLTIIAFLPAFNWTLSHKLASQWTDHSCKVMNSLSLWAVKQGPDNFPRML